jgi:hypothetical protein
MLVLELLDRVITVAMVHLINPKVVAVVVALEALEAPLTTQRDRLAVLLQVPIQLGLVLHHQA